MLKRGLSEIIAIVLIILISLISISIIWLFVQPLLLEKLGSNENGSINNLIVCAKLDLAVKSCSDSGEAIYSVKVNRGIGSSQISELKFLFKDSKGKTFILSNNSVPREFGSKNYIFDFNRSGREIVSVDVASVLGNNICGFTGASVSCSEELSGLGEGNETEGDGCEINKGIVYLDDFEDNCTRIRNGLINSNIEPMPYIGFHSVGALHLPATSAVGAEFHRLIISWHNVYNGDGSFKEDIFNNATLFYKSENTKILLTIKANDPNRSTCSYQIGERSIDERDSYPKNEAEWTNYVKFVVDKYYVQPVNNGSESVLAGIQLGNEWSHQFVVNTTGNPTCDPRNTIQEVKFESMIKLMNLTYSAMQEAQESLNPGEERLPMITYGLTGVDNFALKRGFNLENITYDGFLENGIINNTPKDIDESSVEKIEDFIINSSSYYDYLDIHFRSNYYQDHGYVAQWIRDLWKDNGIMGKGLSSTEYGGPFYFYTTDYQKYFIPSSLTHSFFEGFDSIAWASWVPAKKLTFKVNFGLEAMTNFNGGARQYARDGYKRFTDESKGYSKIRLIGTDTYVFLNASDDEIGRLNLSEGVPAIPTTYEQCSDTLDNDNDGLVDGGELDYCGDGYFNNSGGVDVEFNETGIYF
ncbi:hypothetical protein AUJ84_04305 [Candidatus Pacearchaeota archaeon CG1_02_32_132]|nr:MAG: hypothetical protein AUJ84_04305 [Candidatus Pacearchaeota archaeon CG1_02_32_132]